MGVFVETGSFRKAVSFAAGALPKRDGAPELSGMWLRARGDRLVLSAFDGLQSAEAGVEAQSTDAEASLLVNGAALVSSVRALPTGEPKTKLTFTEGGLTMRCGKALFGLRGMRTEDYPVPPEPPVDGAVEIDAKDFSKALEVVATAVAKPGALQSMPALMSLRLHVSGGRLALEASDRLRMAEVTLEAEGDAATEWSALVDPDRLDLSKDGTVVLRCDGRRLLASSGDRRRNLPLLGVDYPDLSKALGDPDSRPYAVAFDRAALLESLKRAMAVTDKAKPRVTLTATDGGTADLLAAGDGDSRKYRETLDCKASEGGLGCRFDPNLVADFLAAMDCDEVTLAWRRNGARQPFEIKGPEGIRCVVSPVVRD